jgi:glycosyltransferase involved in cell wall biosynthesis
MPRAAESDRDETLRREMDALLRKIDAELQRPIRYRRWFDWRIGRLKKHMIAPPFLRCIKADPGLPSPVVSVVLPTHNRAACIGEAIASVQGQTFTDWELIVVDDGSTDGTSEVVATALPDARIRYVVNSWSGHSAARNAALRLSRGAFIAYLDSDNLWYPNFLKAAVAALTSHRDVDCVYGALDTAVHLSPPWTILFEAFDRDRLVQRNYIDLNTVVHRRVLTDDYGLFDENLDRLVDWDILLRFTQHKPARRVPVLAARYRIVDDQRVSAMRPFASNLEAIQCKWPQRRV